MRPLLSFVVALALSVIAAQAFAQQPAQKKGPAAAPPPPPPQQQAPAVAAVKPYQEVTVKVQPASTDPSFGAFRKQLADIATKKDRAALGRLTVARGFFWESGSGNKTDAKKNSIQNLAAALNLDSRDGDGWETLEAAAQETTLEAVPDRQGVMCSPAGPQFDDKAFDEVLKASETDISEWGFAVGAKIEVRGAGNLNAPVAETLGPILIRLLPEDSAAAPSGANPQDIPFMKVATPSGKTGFVRIDAIAPLAFDQLCYIKDATGWKITGYFGGE